MLEFDVQPFSSSIPIFQIKKEFVKKSLPQAPPKKILRMKNQTLLEEVDTDSLSTLKIFGSENILKMFSLLQRRCSLEDWMNRLLSDIDISRSALIATFLELEAAVRSCMCSAFSLASENNEKRM